MSTQTPHQNSVFVGRQSELEQLSALLEQTLAGEGQVAFVTGEAGSGKTTLVHHFCRQAQVEHKNLVVATGQCDAQTGTGTPYLPFVEILRLLTGDVAGEMADEALSDENVSRLRSSVRFSVDALMAFGPDLVDILVPGSGLVITAGSFVAEQTGLADWLKRRVKQDQPSSGITQDNIFEQYSNVIHKVAEQNPLILVLDDLQWADAASCQLLFRLGRRIEDRPVLILGTYRPNDVAAGRDGDRHPLEPVTAELTRYFGNPRIDLDQKPDTPEAEDNAYEFVSAYVDKAYSPHDLDDDFIRLIADRTEGHPLFTVELLRDLEERGWLAKSPPDAQPSDEAEDARWALTQPVTVGTLPPRVEGIAEERIGRLDRDAQDMLTAAAVEGDEFIAQVVAFVQQLDEREVARRFSRDLDRQHQLVAERGIDRVGRERIYRFAFRHALFQTYLYNTLGEIDRSLMHEDVGVCLEDLYADQTDDIAVELVYHFSKAGLEERALPYLIEAGDQARRTFANQEALDYYSRALSIIDDMAATAPAEEGSDWEQQRFNVLCRREEVYDRLGKREAQSADLEQMSTLAGELSERDQAEVYVRQSRYFWGTGDYDQAVQTVSQALPLMQAAGDRVGEGEARINLGRAARETGDYEVAFEHFENAVELFDEADAVQRRAEALIQIGTLHSELGQWDEGLQHLEEALDIARQIDARWEQAYALDQIGVIYANMGDYSQALQYSREALASVQAVGSKLREAANLSNIAVMHAYLGGYEQALDLVQEALEIHRLVENPSGESITLLNLADFQRALGRHDEALANLESALELAQQLKRPLVITACHQMLADTYRQRGRPGDGDQAIQHAQEAIGSAEEAGFEHYEVLGLSSLAMGHLARDEVEEAVAASTQAFEKLDSLEAIEGPEEEVYFNHFQVMQAAGRSKEAKQALQQAEQIVRSKAERISDEGLRRDYLEEVPLNREVLRAAAPEQG